MNGMLIRLLIDKAMRLRAQRLVNVTLNPLFEDVYTTSFADMQYIMPAELKTCQGLLSHEVYKKWSEPSSSASTTSEDSTPRALCLTGPPGSGKSVLAAFIFGKLSADQNSNNEKVIYFFFNRQFSRASQPRNLLAALLLQIVRAYPFLAETVVEELRLTDEDANVESSGVSMRLLEGAVKKAFEGLRKGGKEGVVEEGKGRLTIVIDALDEKDDASEWKFYRDLLMLILDDEEEGENNDGNATRLLFTVRESSLHEITFPSLQTINIADHNNPDIARYVASHLASLRTSTSSTLNSTFISQLETEITSRAQGMFLWVRLVLTNLASQTLRPEDLLSTVRGFPDTREELLSHTYDELFRRATRDYKDRAKVTYLRTIFSIVSVAITPLRVDELEAYLEWVGLGGEYGFEEGFGGGESWCFEGRSWGEGCIYT